MFILIITKIKLNYFITLSVWLLSGLVVTHRSINVVTLRQGWLVPGWVTILGDGKITSA